MAWALIFAVAKRTGIEDRGIRGGGWQTGFPIPLAGKTLGLLGAGHLGGAMVPVAKAFGMDVVAWSPNLTEERCAELDVTKVTKDELVSSRTSSESSSSSRSALATRCVPTSSPR
jgi:phosphoglycerate dehydrogenase-like enzyme